jgi:hypothetical protein
MLALKLAMRFLLGLGLGGDRRLAIIELGKGHLGVSYCYQHGELRYALYEVDHPSARRRRSPQLDYLQRGCDFFYQNSAFLPRVGI